MPRPAKSRASGQTLAKPAVADPGEGAGDEQDRGQLDRGGEEAGCDEAAARDRGREEDVEPPGFGRAGKAAGDRPHRQAAERQRHDQAQHLSLQVLLDVAQLADPEGFLQALRVALHRLGDRGFDRGEDRDDKRRHQAERDSPGPDRAAAVEEVGADERDELAGHRSSPSS